MADLNTEPSQPDERAALDLPPKSYAEVADPAPSGDAHKDTNDSKQQGNGHVPNGTKQNGSLEKEQPGKKLKKKNKGNGELVLEKIANNKLTTVKTEDDEDARESEKPTRRELVSGRRAGAGWDKSG